jgi:hypothetical protein
MEIKEVANLIELQKRKGTLELKKSIGGECEDELKSVNEILSSALSKASSSGIDIVVPRQGRIEDIESLLKSMPPQDVKAALERREGEAYELLSERANIAASNSQNKYEIAKLLVTLSKMDDVERANIVSAIKNAKVDAPLKVGSLKDDERLRLVKLLFRCGIACALEDAEIKEGEPQEKEVPLTVENKRVWVDAQTSRQLEENLKKMEVLGSELQVRNAKRHVMTFSEEEEQKYASLQADYLDLLKQQDELLKDYNAELAAES